MFVGICKLKLYLAGNRSLKEKRHVLHKLKDRLRNKFMIAIAEVGEHQLWQSSVVGLSLVGNDKGFVDSELRKVLNHIEAMHIVQIVDEEIEIIKF